MKRFTLLLKRIKNNGLIQTSIGFITFLLIAAGVMLLMESTESSSGINSFLRSLWFSVVTVTTVGYGDLSPISSFGRIAAVVIMFIGIAYSGVITGNITSWLVERNRKKERGLVPLKKLEKKFIICGWKSDIHSLLLDILQLHKKTSDNLILVNMADPVEVNELKQDPLLRDLQFYIGDHTTREVLENISAENAERVMILADDTSDRKPDEIDFQSVLTAMAFSRINPQIYTIVEIIQSKFQSYLHQAKVEEIILQRKSARALMCNVALMSGLYNVFQAFFNLQNGILDTRNVPSHYIGKSYQEIQGLINDVVIIGVLENRGNLNKRKRERLEQIQKQSSILKSIDGLIGLKQMVSNKPVFHPPPDYKLTENSALIILKRNPGVLHQPFDYSKSHYPEVRKKTLKEMMIHSQMNGFFLKAGNWDNILEMMKKVGFTLVAEDGLFCGIKVKEYFYDLETLDILDEQIQILTFLYKLQSASREEAAAIHGKLPFTELYKTDLIKKIQKRREEKKTRKGVLMICGWKPRLIQMVYFLLSQFEAPSVNWYKIVVVADIDVEKTTTFFTAFEGFDEIELVRGDFKDRNVLLEAGVQKATKIMILAETESGKSLEELDAQTVLTAMLIRKMNKHAYKVVEILDRRFEETLKQTDIEEVVLIDEFNRIMLANGSNGLGVTNIVNQIINIDTALIEIIDIDEKYIRQTFGTLNEEMKIPGSMMLGLLEETGNVYVRKLERIRQAQVLPSIKDSVEELKQVHCMAANKVIIAPKNDYIIQANSQLIVLNSSEVNKWQQYISEHHTAQPVTG